MVLHAHRRRTADAGSAGGKVDAGQNPGFSSFFCDKNVILEAFSHILFMFKFLLEVQNAGVCIMDERSSMVINRLFLFPTTEKESFFMRQKEGRLRPNSRSTEPRSGIRKTDFIVLKGVQGNQHTGDRSAFKELIKNRRGTATNCVT